MNSGVKIAYYRKRDWDKLMDMIVDRESMHPSWEDWFTSFTKTKKILSAQGFEVTHVTVDLQELTDYCRQQGIENDGKARSRFVQEKGSI